MKLTPIFIALLLLGCTSLSGEEFKTYESKELGFSFEKPASWQEANDPLSLVRFKEVGKITLSITFLPGKTADNFDEEVNEIHAGFLQNAGLINVERSEAELDNFPAVLLTARQEGGEFGVAQSELRIVKDALNNRVLLVALTWSGEADSKALREARQRVLDSFEILRMQG